MSNVLSPVLSVRRLKVHYPLSPAWPWRAGGVVRAVDDVHFDLRPGEALGVVGESGCGKSTLARALAGLQPVTAGGIVYQGRDLVREGPKGWNACRRDIQLVFQDPQSSLDPGQTIGAAIEEPLEFLCPELDPAARRVRVATLLAQVDLAPELAQRYPHELSGGQCQRAAIARALAPGPRVLICDEPVSALDSETQGLILDLFARLQADTGLALVFVAHDLSAVRQLCQRVLVMYLGRIAEQARSEDLFTRPRHPYTRLLMASAGIVAPDREWVEVNDEMPNPADPPSGCVFRTRCAMADTLCAREVPHLRKAGGSSHAACHYVEDVAEIAPAV